MKQLLNLMNGHNLVLKINLHVLYQGDNMGLSLIP